MIIWKDINWEILVGFARGEPNVSTKLMISVITIKVIEEGVFTENCIQFAKRKSLFPYYWSCG